MEQSTQLKSDNSASTMVSKRLENESPWFFVSESDVGYYADYAWVNNDGKRIEKPVLEIQDKLLASIKSAKKFVVASWFLFDCMQPEKPSPVVRNIVDEVTQALIDKAKDPAMKIAVILDPLNRAYRDRTAPAVQRLLDAGINVFYSDLTQTPPAAKDIADPVNQLLLKIDAAQYQGLSYDSVQQAVIDDYRSVFSALDSSVVGDILPQLSASDMKKLKQNLVKDEALVAAGKKLQIDGHKITLDTIYSLLLLKANHRKLLVVDSDDTIEALVASANPHNPSIPSANSALSVKGEAAQYVLDVLRQDFEYSIKKSELQKDEKNKKRFAMWSPKSTETGLKWLDSVFSVGNVASATAQSGAKVRFVTENKISNAVRDMLQGVTSDDIVRIQMFYLSEPALIEDIIDAGTRVSSPVRLILDPNKDAFNQIKDGTPNRQVARYMLDEAKKRGSKLEIRWYDTHGEQNHAKVMSITGPGKNQIITGSANWTGKNIGYSVDTKHPERKGSPNMEANLVVYGSPAINKRFSTIFEILWNNDPLNNRRYSVKFDTEPYNKPVDDGAKWRKGEASGLVSW